jgi:hypothetical protein
MMTLEDAPSRPYRLSWTRRIIGALVCLVAAALIAMYVLDRVIRDNVFLRSHFENYMTGIGVLLVITVIGLIILLPVHNPAAQNRRQMTRIVILGAAFFVFVSAGLLHGFSFLLYRPSVVATSPDHTRRVALVKVGQFSELHVWVGTGLGAKITGDLGAPCELSSVEFKSESEILVSTSLGDTTIKLDPAGRPLNTLTQNCRGSFQSIGAPTAPSAAPAPSAVSVTG